MRTMKKSGEKIKSAQNREEMAEMERRRGKGLWGGGSSVRARTKRGGRRG
jgi:hypothetical protein